mmetsp:Transcript_31175/g.75372  ORF Transcript_31175/g.75372 Transcript_31175/m.75372 type:complete len:244 (-) Transcript_31175:1199-1930(-)
MVISFSSSSSSSLSLQLTSTVSLAITPLLFVVFWPLDINGSMPLKDRSIKLVLLLVSSSSFNGIASSLHPTASAKNCVCNRVLNLRNRFNRLSDPAMTYVLAVSPSTQGWCSISNADSRFFGSRSMRRCMRSRADGLKWRVKGCLGPKGNARSSSRMSRSISSSVARPLMSNGCTPVSMMYTITPSAHMSAGGRGGESRSSNASGDEYAGVNPPPPPPPPPLLFFPFLAVITLPLTQLISSTS